MDDTKAQTRKISSFRELLVWQKSMALAEVCYREMSPKIDAALSLQMWRAAVSIPSNIAEGHELPTGAYWHHVRIALGSLSEIDTQLELIGRLSMLPAARVRAMQADVAELRRMLRSLRASLMRTAQRNGRPKPRSLE